MHQLHVKAMKGNQLTFVNNILLRSPFYKPLLTIFEFLQRHIFTDKVYIM